MSNVLIFGASGDIGKAIAKKFKKDYSVTRLSFAGRDSINFLSDKVEKTVHDIIVRHDPDIIINCVGILCGDLAPDAFNNTFKINLESNWAIIKHFMQYECPRNMHVIMIGSSAYHKPSKDYMLYAASKAALYSLWASSCEYFNPGQPTVSLINPVRVLSRMMPPGTQRFITTDEVADVVYEVSQSPLHQMVDMQYNMESVI